MQFWWRCQGTLEELEPNISAYRRASKEAGHRGEGKGNGRPADRPVARNG
jgi:hypothetical protein